jgi:hypothetical protein
LVDDEKGGKAFEGDQEEEKTDKMRSFVFKSRKRFLG